MTRRPNHTGTIVQRSDGSYQGSLQVEGNRATVYGRSKAEVRTKLDALRQQATVNGSLPEPGHTLGALLDQWLAVGRPHWKPRTAADYEHMATLIREGLGDLALSKITATRLQAFYARLQGTPRVALYAHQVLHRTLRLAVQWGWLPTNPADRVVRPGYQKKERDLWTVQQCRHFVLNTEDSPWWPLWTLALLTGCRYGELIGLRWTDVDAGQQTLKVERSLQRINRQWVETTPKTRSGKRTICLDGLALKALQRQRVLQAEWRLKVGPGWQDTGRVFTNRHGGPLEKASTQQALAKACREMSLPVISPHCLRHLSASLALQQGAPVALVSRQLGHANVGITTTIYSHAITDGRAVAQALEDILTQARVVAE